MPPSRPTLGVPSIALSAASGALDAVYELVANASGPFALVVVGVYSFLIAFVLPLPSEVVLLPAAHLRLGVPDWVQFALVVLVSGVGKAAGSVLALSVGYGASHAGPVTRGLRRLGFDPVAWSRNRLVAFVRRYGYGGLAVALCVPGFPDTLSLYAFSVLDEDYPAFALATFLGSVGRLVLVYLGAKGVLAAR